MSDVPKTPADQIIIDISHYQPTPDWDKLKAGGTVGIILKATENVSYKDPTYYSRETAARERGLFTAAYHFLRPGNIEKQMQWFVKTVAPAPGDRLVIDYEDAKIPFSDLEKATQWLIDNTQCEITIYGSNVLTEACAGKKSAILEQTSLWQARYSSGSNQPKVPTNIWPTWSVWQWTQFGKIDGITGDVDLNRWNGDPANLPGWFDANAITPPVPEPEPEPVPPVEPGVVHITIDAPDGVKIYVNGVEVPN